MTEQIQLPAPPTDRDLNLAIPSRPVWRVLDQLIEGVDGKALFEQERTNKDLGWEDSEQVTLAQIQQADAKARDYQKAFEPGGAYWDSPYGKAEKALKAAFKLFSDPRIAEEKRGAEFRQRCNSIFGGYNHARSTAEFEARLRVEQQQRDDDGHIKQERIRRLEQDAAEHQHDKFALACIQEEIESVKADPYVPPVVTPQQAAAAANLPPVSKGLISNKKPIYEHTVVDMRKLVTWLNANPGYIDRFTIAPQHMALKSVVFPQESGILTREKHVIQNRSK